MKFKSLLLLPCSLFLGLSTLYAQGDLSDTVVVDLPYRVTVDDRVLEPGQYKIRQSSISGNHRVLHFFKEDQLQMEATAVTIPVLDTLTAEETRVILNRIGNEYFFDKIWVQGSDYGYQFVLPDAVKRRMRERLEPAAVIAQYQAPEPPVVAQAPPPPPEAPPPPPEAPPEPEPAPPPEPPPAREVLPVTSANWLTLLLSGAALAGAGWFVRRRA